MSRDPLDRYYTPDALALGCIRWLDRTMGQPSHLLEPCSGGGAFGRAALAEWPGVTVAGCDPDPEAAPGYPCERVAAADWRPALVPGFTAIVTNPHYVGVYATVAAMRALQRQVRAGYLALLLRETTIGQLMASDDPPHRIAVSPIRPRWGGAGGAALGSSDLCGSALMVWGRSPAASTTTIEALPAWRPRGR
jgi:hypothetical protein